MEQFKKSMRGILPLLAIFLIATCFSCEEDSSTAWDNICGVYSNYADDAETHCYTQWATSDKQGSLHRAYRDVEHGRISQ